MADRDEPAHAAERLGILAVRKGLLSSEKLHHALERLDERRREGESISLGRHLVELGLLAPAQIRELLSEQGKEMLVCTDPDCRRRYAIAPSVTCPAISIISGSPWSAPCTSV